MVAFATQVKRRRGTQEQNDAFTGAEGEIVVDLTNMTLRVHDGRTRGGFVVGGGAGRNIGDIFFTARTDTSLNGAVEANGGQYNTTDFVGADSIGNILSAGKVPYMTIADFDTAVANNGFCSSFGWDGGTVFKVPKIPGMIITKDQLPVIGTGAKLGVIPTNNSFSGSYSLGVNASTGDAVAMYQANTGANIGVTTNPTQSGIIATVDTVELRPMVQLANGATDEAVVVAGNVLADIAGIKDGDGFTQTGKNTIIGWSMPDYSAGVVVADGYQTTFPCFITLIQSALAASNSAVVIRIDGEIATLNVTGGNVSKRLGTSCYVDAGHTITIDGSDGSPVLTVYPLKGVNQ